MDNRDFYFEYYDGKRTVYGDPFQIHRALVRVTAGTLEQLLKEARDNNVVAAAVAVEKILAATVAAFQLAPFDRLTGEGLMEKDVHAVLKRFRDWESGLKKKLSSSPT